MCRSFCPSGLVLQLAPVVISICLSLSGECSGDPERGKICCSSVPSSNYATIHVFYPDETIASISAPSRRHSIILWGEIYLLAKTVVYESNGLRITVTATATTSLKLPFMTVSSSSDAERQFTSRRKYHYTCHRSGGRKTDRTFQVE